MTLSLLRSQRLYALLFAAYLAVLKLTEDNVHVTTTWRGQEEWSDHSSSASAVVVTIVVTV
jgi:hypothetical protein